MFGLFGTRKKYDFSTLPVADIRGNTSGPTLLITAGLDGDEYAGIEAAYVEAEKYKDGNFSGRLIILPIVNVAGFHARCSENPIDKKFPKYCIPGKAGGTASEQLMHYVVETYASNAMLWLDLHSGNQYELAIPCLWNDVTGNREVDARGLEFIHASGVTASVREPAGIASRALAKFECTYILIESEDEDQHVSWIDIAMQQLGMIAGTPAKHPTRIFHSTRSVYREKDMQNIASDEVLLWQKVAGPQRLGERLGEIAYGELPL